MGYHRILDCNTGCCDTPEALASVTRTGAVLNFADTKGKQTTIDLTELLPDVKALVSVERSGTTLTFTDTAGKTYTVELDTMPEVPVAYKDAVLNGSTLRFTDTAGVTHDINLSSLTPASKADRFLSDVQYDAETKQLTFTTSAEGEENKQFTVNVADLLSVTVADGLRGNGTTADPLKVNAEDLKGAGIKVENNNFAVDYDPETMELTADGKLRAKQQPASSGLNCEAIGKLPKRAWKAGTVLLAQQDGECVQLASTASVFQQVGVGITASAKQVVNGDTTHVVVTVSNVGEGTNENTTLNIVRPAGNYTVTNVTHASEGVGSVEKKSDVLYELNGITKGGVVKVEFDVTTQDVGTLQFGANIDPHSSLDMIVSDNTTSMVITSTPRTTYKPTAECPLITATDIATNTNLRVISPNAEFAALFRGGAVETAQRVMALTNTYTDGKGLAGRKIKLKGASTVVVTTGVTQLIKFTGQYDLTSTSAVQRTPKMLALAIAKRNAAAAYADKTTAVDDATKQVYPTNTIGGEYGSSPFSPQAGLVYGTHGVALGLFADGSSGNTPPHGLVDLGTFDPATETFTFRDDIQQPTLDAIDVVNAPESCILWCRPTGADCAWQGIVLGVGAKLPELQSSEWAHNVVSGDVNITSEVTRPEVIKPSSITRGVAIGRAWSEDTQYIAGNSLTLQQYIDSPQLRTPKYTATVRRGTAAEFTFTNTDGLFLPQYLSTGKTSTIYDEASKTLTVRVAADATPTDSVAWDYLDIKVVD